MKQVVHIADLAAEPAYAERDPLRVATVEIAGGRTFLGVPMLKENQLQMGTLQRQRRSALKIRAVSCRTCGLPPAEARRTRASRFTARSASHRKRGEVHQFGPAFTPEMQQAWIALYDAIQAEMISAAKSKSEHSRVD